MRKFLFIFLFCMAILTGYAQKIGFKAGVLMSNLIPSQMTASVEPLYGLYGSTILEIRYSQHSSFQTELSYSMQGAKLTDSIVGTVKGFYYVTERLNYISVPVSYKARIGGKHWKIFSNFGAELAILVSNNRKLSAAIGGIPVEPSIYHPWELNPVSFKIFGGLGFMYRSIFIDGSAHIGLKNIYAQNTPVVARNMYVCVTFGTFIYSKSKK